jgi:hypothetical protein
LSECSKQGRASESVTAKWAIVHQYQEMITMSASESVTAKWAIVHQYQEMMTMSASESVTA